MSAALLLELGEPLEIEDVELLAPGPNDVIVHPAPIVDRRFTLDEINDAFAAAEAREVLTGVVVTG